jgi:hypothetical protein
MIAGQQVTVTGPFPTPADTSDWQSRAFSSSERHDVDDHRSDAATGRSAPAGACPAQSLLCVRPSQRGGSRQAPRLTADQIHVLGRPDRRHGRVGNQQSRYRTADKDHLLAQIITQTFGDHLQQRRRSGRWRSCLQALFEQIDRQRAFAGAAAAHRIEQYQQLVQAPGFARPPPARSGRADKRLMPRTVPFLCGQTGTGSVPGTNHILERRGRIAGRPAARQAAAHTAGKQ